eukprot:5864309-Amphidinium_carterae.2
MFDSGKVTLCSQHRSGFTSTQLLSCGTVTIFGGATRPKAESMSLSCVLHLSSGPRFVFRTVFLHKPEL